MDVNIIQNVMEAIKMECYACKIDEEEICERCYLESMDLIGE